MLQPEQPEQPGRGRWRGLPRRCQVVAPWLGPCAGRTGFGWEGGGRRRSLLWPKAVRGCAEAAINGSPSEAAINGQQAAINGQQALLGPLPPQPPLPPPTTSSPPPQALKGSAGLCSAMAYDTLQARPWHVPPQSRLLLPQRCAVLDLLALRPPLEGIVPPPPLPHHLLPEGPRGARALGAKTSARDMPANVPCARGSFAYFPLL